MTTLEKIKVEIAKEVEKHYEEWQYVAGLMTAKDIFEKYAEPTTLDKIKAEIEKSRYGLVSDGLDIALQIIDKYRAESEEK